MAHTRKYPTPNYPTITDVFAAHNEVFSPAGSAFNNTTDPNNTPTAVIPMSVLVLTPTTAHDLISDNLTFPVIQIKIVNNRPVYMATDPQGRQ